ncbi:MAG: glycosyltransferase [Apibacter sp.]|nr:glycosyltransferase [Apibacter sp.]
MNKALVHDWYCTIGGGEMVVKALNEIWDDFDLFSLVDSFDDKKRDEILNGKKVTTSFIQKIPTAKKNHRKFLQLYPQAIEQLDVSKYDLIISSSSSIAKGVLSHTNQLHICYCHSPARYAWDLYQHYLLESGLNQGLKGLYAKYILHKFRIWDVISSNRVDYFIANSNNIAKRIKKIYNKDSEVIYPPIDTEFFSYYDQKSEFYLAASRMVPYKKMDLIVETFNTMPDKKLIVIGDGPDFKKIASIAKDNIELKGFVSNETLKFYLQRAKGFIFAADEDFGILPVEAQACGTPVIALGKGGALETIIPGVTGVFFKKHSVKSLKAALEEFSKIEFNYKKIRDHALNFSKEKFKNKIKKFVLEKYQEFQDTKSSEF